MSLVLTPRDGEAEVVAYWSAHLDVPVVTHTRGLDDGTLEVPLLRIDLTAAYRQNKITDSFQVSFQGYDSSKEQARDLTATAYRLAWESEWDDASPVRGVTDVGGPVPFNDPNFPDIHRYQATVLLRMRGV